MILRSDLMKSLAITCLAAAVGLVAVEFTAEPAHAQSVKSSAEIGAALERQRSILQSGQGGTAACPDGIAVDCGRGITIYSGSNQGSGTASGSGQTQQQPLVQQRTQTGSQQTASTTVRRQPKNKRVAAASLSVPELPQGEQLDLVILFDYDSAFIRPASRPQLAELCKAINAGTGGDKFYIIGHTDAAGSSTYNIRLSQARAKEVKRHLVNQCGIDSKRLSPIGMGEERLNPSYQPRSQEQRRVEIMLKLG
jgi:outer membrane protein OmpA-like peptidoglycan-associated protein